MSALDPSVTARLWLDYTYKGTPHSVQLRYATAAEAIVAAPVWLAALTANAAAFYIGTEFTGARVANPGTNVSNDLPGWTGTGGTQTPNGDDALDGVTLGFVGRSTDGHKVRYFWYGAYLQSGLPSDFRYNSAEAPLMTAFLADFVDVAVETGLVTIGGLPPVMKGYVNGRVNGYYQSKARLTGGA